MILNISSTHSTKAVTLANEIIHLHKGSVTAYNYLDGAVFEVKLPIVD